MFFLQIGIDADISAFARAGVLRDAALLLAVAVVGKLLSPLGAIGSPGDKPLIGLGMLPRGEVGLIEVKGKLTPGYDGTSSEQNATAFTAAVWPASGPPTGSRVSASHSRTV